MMKTILIADDESDILEFLSYNFKKEGFIVYTSENGLKAVESAKTINPDIILLDVMMPVMDGIEACIKIRENPATRNCIIIFLSARSEEFTQVAALESGADDYIVKPVKPKILLSKINAISRRSDLTVTQEKKAKTEKLIIEKDSYIVQYCGAKIELPKKEFDLLSLLASRPGKVFSREEIYNAVWGTEIIVGDRTIDVHINKLRSRLSESIIKTIKGVGYKLEENE